MVERVSFSIIYLLFSVFAVFIGRAAWPHRTKPAGKWFLLNIAGMAGWSVAWAGTLLAPSGVIAHSIYSTVFVFLYMSVIGLTLMAYEYTQRRQVRLGRVVPLLVIPVATIVIVATNEWHHLMWGESFAISERGIITFPFGDWFYVHAVYNYALLLAGLSLLLADIVRSDGIYRRQASILFVGMLFPIGFNVVDTLITGVPYVALTPIGYLIGSVLWAYGLFRFRLFEVVPMARRTALSEMNDAVVMIDSQGTVVGANDAAHDLFEFGSNPTGQHIRDAFRRYPGIVQFLQADRDEATLSLGGTEALRYLNATRTTISSGQTDAGQVVVFQDVTGQKERENELRLLKSVLARVLRHNIRNDMGVVLMNARSLAEETDDSSDAAAAIIDRCEGIIETSEKARTIERIVGDDRVRSEVDLVEVVTGVVASFEETDPDATFETDLPDEQIVLADATLDLAVQNLIENAIEHTDGAAHVQVSVTESDSEATLTVEDNGPGIPSETLAVIRDKEIDQLNHSSGVGLWLVQWVVETSGGSLAFEYTGRGTRVEISLDLPLSSRAHPESR